MQVRDFEVATPRGRLHARRWDPAGVAPGAAPWVLFHDSLGCVALWRDFPQRLAMATARGVIAYDRLGFGQSDPHPGVLAIDFIHAEAQGDFSSVRTALGFDRFLAFGHSVGGGMAVGVAAALGDACAGLVTESAQAFVEDRTIAGIEAARRDFAAPAQRERLAKYHGGKADWVLSAWIDTWLSPAFAGWNLDADLARVHCPALVLHGIHDEYGSMRHPRRIAGAIAGPATLIELDCGHVPHRELADDVLGGIGRWQATL